MRASPVLAAVVAIVLVAAGVFAGATPADATIVGDVPIVGMDLHDGTILQTSSADYIYGTRYSCGFEYGTNGTPWCGFYVAKSETDSVAGIWSPEKQLVNPDTRIEATGWSGDNGLTWDKLCGINGIGCYNPRMTETPAGKWLLWFNANVDKERGANPYWVLTCSGPAGPCGSPHKPAIYGALAQGGDFSIAKEGSTGYIVASGAGRIIDIEKLNAAMTDGAGSPVTGLSGTTASEGPGIFRTSSGEYEAVFSDPNCGYCTGEPLDQSASGASKVHTGYATAPHLSGPWTFHGYMPGGSCTGQPRTAFTAQGVSYEWVDMWTGTANETAASILLVPMTEFLWSCGVA